MAYENLCDLSSNVFFMDKWRKKNKGELVNPDSPAKGQ